jgi:uncharacterized protein
MMSVSAEQQILALVGSDAWTMDILRLARRLALPDWAIGAGFIRGLVWDRLCGFEERTPLNDIDVVYFDPARVSREAENAAEAQLATWHPDQVWSVRNMARMHIRNHDAPYRDTADAIGHWLETPTAIAISMAHDDSLRLIAPHGVDDLLAGRVRPTPSGRRKIEEYRARVAQKAWTTRWPRLHIEEMT